MAIEVKTKDLGAKRIFRQLRELDGLKLMVGYQGSEGGALHPDSSITVAHMAAVHEYGGGDTPERSFMRSALTLRARDIAKAFEVETAAIIKGRKKIPEAMGTIGELAVRIIRERLQSSTSWARQLDPDTASEKGSTKPLDASGTLAKALSWRLMRGNTVLAGGK